MKTTSLPQLLALFCVLCGLAPIGPAAPGSLQAAQEVRLATILPRGLDQDTVLKKLEQDWNRATGGTVILRKAPGGQRDGEAGIVQKLNAGASGYYQAALLSATGLAQIDQDAAALQMMPLVFRNWDEVDFVREKIGQRIAARLLAKGFVVLFWADMGWVNFFSTKPGAVPADFRSMRMFAWAGDNKQVAIMKSLGYQPIALETADVFSSLGSGMIQAAPLPPAFALGTQIHSVAPYVLELNWAPIVGAAIIRKDAWENIPADLRKTLLARCAQAGADIRAEGRRFHQDALTTLAKGPTSKVHVPSADEHRQWQALAEELAPKIRGQLVPADLFDEVQRLLKDYRAAPAGEPSQSPRP